MYMIAEVLQYVAVASFAEAWIEITSNWSNITKLNVASFAEAWIEILLLSNFPAVVKGRLLRGGVD